jgi:hypothetical protein
VALPLIRIRFQIMNSVNGSTGYSGFQLLMGRLPRWIPPFMELTNEDHGPEAKHASELIERLKWDVEDVKDHGPEDIFQVGDNVMLSTLYHWREFTANDPSHVAKFIPCFDGAYVIVNSMLEFLAYTLDLPNSPNIFPTFHSSQLKNFTKIDASLFCHANMHTWAQSQWQSVWKNM